MSNRAGKREREARNRKKRGGIGTMFVTRNGTESLMLMLGHKKIRSVMRSDKPGHRQLKNDMVAVPVDDSGTPIKTNVGEANVVALDGRAKRRRKRDRWRDTYRTRVKYSGRQEQNKS